MDCVLQWIHILSDPHTVAQEMHGKGVGKIAFPGRVIYMQQTGITASNDYHSATVQHYKVREWLKGRIS